ncbi:hypothetical protein AHF37_01373 [Paragonimus kellicotti]|nr:hypothetical protein AHF37_01373 [Paragonimus kellicotti]
MADNHGPLTSRRKQRTRGRGPGSRPLDSERRITDASRKFDHESYILKNLATWF